VGALSGVCAGADGGRVDILTLLAAVFYPNAFMSSSIFKTGSKLGLSMALIAGLAWWALPTSITRYTDVTRGNALSHKIDNYYQQHQNLPNTGDWQKLNRMGFSTEELNKAYPEYRKVSDTAYELTFVEGFDGPYLMWSSKERQWKMGMPTFPTR
jgi:hypothetical protein